MTNEAKATYGSVFLATVLLLSVVAVSFPAVNASTSTSEDEIWTREFGTDANEGNVDVATDSSGVYVSGFTAGTFPGQRSAGGTTDAFIKKFDHDGNELWTVQLGTSGDDSASAIAVDDSGLYVVGQGIGIYKFDHDGNELWNHPIDNVTAVVDVSADGSGVYVVGNTQVNLTGATKVGPDDWTTPPMFLRKYEPTTGNVVYTVQFGIGPGQFTEVDGQQAPNVYGVDVFAGKVYVVGQSFPPDAEQPLHSHGFLGVFANKFNAEDGSLVWTAFQGCGPTGGDNIDAVQHGIFIAGLCFVQPGAAIGTGDGYLAKLDDNTGNWALFDRLRYDIPLVPNFPVSAITGLTVDDSGVYTAGSITKQLPEPSTTQFFLKRFDYDGNELSSTDVPQYPQKVSANSTGVYLIGLTTDTFPGLQQSGQLDVYLRKYVESTGVPEEVAVTVKSLDLGKNPLPGMWTTIRNATTDEVIKTGFTPVYFTGITGVYYKVSVSNYDGKVFSYWLDSPYNNNRIRTLTLPSGNNTTFIAVYDVGDALRGFTPLSYTGTEEQPDLTVNAVSLEGNKTLHMWAIIDPQSTNSSGTTYRVYATNGYQNLAFDHWDDNGSTDRIRTLTIMEDTTITAYYRQE